MRNVVKQAKIEKVLNKSEVEELFRKEAVFIDYHDVIPEDRAIALFGTQAIEFAMDFKNSTCNIYGLGEGKPCLSYLNKSGFERAVTYHNIIKLSEML